VLDFVAIETPWKETPPYLPAMSAKLTNRGHVFAVGWQGKGIQPCEQCGMRKPKRGGWDRVCPSAP
jgi:hypothetical protein